MGQTIVNEVDLRVGTRLLVLAHEHTVWTEIAMDIASLVHLSELVEQLKADLDSGLEAELAPETELVVTQSLP